MQSIPKADAPSPTISATVFASATVPPPPTLTQAAESASLARLTASPASPTLSAMPAMPASTSPMVSALPPPSPAPTDSSGTTECATPPAPSEAAPKETSARESARLVHGHTTTAATGPAPLSTPPTMPALIPAPPELPSSMESASPVPRLADQANSSMPVRAHAETVNFPALSARSLPHSARLVLLE